MESVQYSARYKSTIYTLQKGLPKNCGTEHAAETFQEGGARRGKTDKGKKAEAK